MIKPLEDHHLVIYPSENFLAIIKKLNGENASRNIKNIQDKVKKSDIFSSDLNETLPKELFGIVGDENSDSKELFINVEDLIWLKNALKSLRKIEPKCPRLCHLLAESTIVIPKNLECTRDKNLEARCVTLRNQQLNREYKLMTKNVDNTRLHQPEDTIAFQMKEMNRQLIAVFQFIVSVFAGFAFGFIGIELLIGALDFGFRLLLGIICALIIALAEIYFLAKKLAETDQQVDATHKPDAPTPKEGLKPHRD